MQIAENTWVLRVPGGWLYMHTKINQMCFVAEHPEFLDDSDWGDRETVQVINAHEKQDKALEEVTKKVKRDEAVCILGETEDPFARCKTCG